MANRSKNTSSAIVVIAVVFHLALGYLVLTNTFGLKDFFLGGSGGFVVSPDQIEQTVLERKAQRSEVYVERADALDDSLQAILGLRESLVEKVSGKRGETYLQEMQVLLEDRHAKLNDEAHPEAVVAAYARVCNVERRVNNAYLDIIACRMAVEFDITAIDAVAYAKVVQPLRKAMDIDIMTKTIRTTRDGEFQAFKNQILQADAEIAAVEKFVESVVKALDPKRAGQQEGYDVEVDGLFGGSAQGDTLRPDQLNPLAEGTADSSFQQIPGWYIRSGPAANRNIWINQWWVMGPYDNPFRKSIDHKFTPETVINLDQQDIGKGGKPIKWEFWNFKWGTESRLEPPYKVEQNAVYYGYTQIRVEEAGEYWVAVGSDDYGKLWVNDFSGDPVWTSGKQPQAFRDSADTIPLQLKAGINELLFRCENGGGTMGWSVVFLLASM